MLGEKKEAQLFLLREEKGKKGRGSFDRIRGGKVISFQYYFTREEKGRKRSKKKKKAALLMTGKTRVGPGPGERRCARKKRVARNCKRANLGREGGNPLPFWGKGKKKMV